MFIFNKRHIFILNYNTLIADMIICVQKFTEKYFDHSFDN